MKKILAILALSLVLGFAGCDSSTGDGSGSGTSSSLVGTWANGSASVSMTFQSSGKVILTDIIASDTTFDTGTWKVSGNTLTMILDGDTSIATYAISGSSLTLSSGSRSVTYTKVGASSSSSTSTSTTTNSAVVGIWKHAYTDSTSSTVEKETVFATFASGGTFSTVSIYYYKSGSTTELDTNRTSGTWTATSDSLYLTRTSKTSSSGTSTTVKSYAMKYRVSGSSLMTIENSDTTVFTKAASIVLPTYARAASAARVSAVAVSSQKWLQ